jgi:hypothetical protein
MDQGILRQGTEGWIGEVIRGAIAGFYKMCYFECRKFQYKLPQDLQSGVESSPVKLGVVGVF